MMLLGNQETQKTMKIVTKDRVNCFCSICLFLFMFSPAVAPNLSANPESHLKDSQLWNKIKETLFQISEKIMKFQTQF